MQWPSACPWKDNDKGAFIVHSFVSSGNAFRLTCILTKPYLYPGNTTGTRGRPTGWQIRTCTICVVFSGVLLVCSVTLGSLCTVHVPGLPAHKTRSWPCGRSSRAGSLDQKCYVAACRYSASLASFPQFSLGVRGLYSKTTLSAKQDWVISVAQLYCLFPGA